jgi:hypothetical protein
MDLVIDKGSGLILERVLYDEAGQVSDSERVTHLEINPKLPYGEPQVTFPRDVRFRPLPPTTNFDWQATPARPMMTVSDDGDRRVTLEEAARRGGGDKLITPAWLPPGFTLNEVVFGWGMQAMYRAGLDYLLIQTLWGKDWTPILEPPGTSYKKGTIGSGYFAGAGVHYENQNTALVRGHGLTVLVSGSLSREELNSVLDSLRPYEP